MTPEGHNKTLGILYLVYGGFLALILLAMVVYFLSAGMFTSVPENDLGVFLLVIISVFLVIYLVAAIPPLVAGYGMLKRKSWARTGGIIAGAFAGMNFPVGTALCIYSIWFLTSDTSKGLYPETQAQPKQREALYGAPPPRQPPDWRG